MKMVQTKTLTLVSSSVPEAPPALWLVGTTYGEGDFAHTVDGLELVVWESLQAANTGNAPASSPAWWEEAGRTYPEYDVGTTYAEGDVVINATTHLQYESLQAGNLGNSLTELDSAWWLETGSTNRYRFQDQTVSAPLTSPRQVVMQLTVSGRATSVAFLNLVASSVRVVATDAVEGVILDQTTNLTSISGITGWWAWFFTPIEREVELFVDGILPYANLTLDITIDPVSGQDVSVGEIVVGLSRDLGTTEERPQIGIADYSIKGQDAFGRTTLVERTYNTRGDFTILCESVNLNQVRRLLTAARATPAVFVTESAEGGTIAIYGFIKTWDAFPTGHGSYLLSLSIQGLT